ncbi:MAG: insulinase family protein [Gammaproteobacteria bacterium]|nr:insulinase family protein [Gammaproteobacteria bacterium]
MFKSRIPAIRLLLGVILAGLLTPATSAVKIQHWTTAQGVPVYYAHAPGIPMVDVQVVFDAGSARDGDQYGLAAMTTAVLDKGAGPWNADQISQRLESGGAILGVSASDDMAALSFRSLTDPEILDSVIQTASTILAEPTFSDQDFNRVKKRVLANLKHELEQPGSIAQKQFNAAIYGSHPYAHPSNGTMDSVKALHRDDLVAFHKRYFVSANALVVIVGDVSRKQSESIANRLLEKLDKGTKPGPIPLVSDNVKGHMIQHQFASEQTHAVVGMPVLSRHDPDYFTLYVGNHILGGSGLVSRISQEVREKRGLAYSAYSYFSPGKRKGPFIMGFQTRNEQAQEALKVLNATLDTYRKNGPTEKELESSKKNITGGFVLRIDSNSEIANYIAMIAYYGLKLDYLDTFNKKIDGVTVDMIKQAFQKRLDPNKFATVLVGQQEAQKQN